jgi:peptidase E
MSNEQSQARGSLGCLTNETENLRKVTVTFFPKASASNETEKFRKVLESQGVNTKQTAKCRLQTVTFFITKAA